MAFDYQTLDSLRQNHPAWRLINSPHAPLIASFLYKTFIAPNIRVISQADLAENLEDELYTIRTQMGDELFPKPAKDYLNDWAATEKGWLRKFYRKDSDEIQYDLTPATEKAIAWLQSLTERAFIGTESRLLTLFELLRQISEGADADPETRIAELEKRSEEIDTELSRARQGLIPLLDDTALKDRFMQFNQLARELLSDFREVEHNFRGLDRNVRERIALWKGKKGELLENIMGDRDAIADSDQGKSFQAFWEFLMSAERQEEFSRRLDQVMTLPAISQLNPDRRTRRIHYDWLEAGEHTQRMVALLSQQLRRFLDDQAWLENRRIMDILQGIEAKCLELREFLSDSSETNDFMAIDETVASVELPMERPLYTPPIKPHLPDIEIELGDERLDASALFAQTVVDKTALAQHIRHALQNNSQITLQELCNKRPIEHGLAELIAYLELAGERRNGAGFSSVIDESVKDTIDWGVQTDLKEWIEKRATLPRIIYLRQLAQ